MSRRSGGNYASALGICKLETFGGHLEALMESKARLLGHPIHTITVPAKILEQWAAKGFPMSSSDFVYKGLDANGRALKRIQYKELDLKAPWNGFDLAHDLTRKGIGKFVADYENTLGKPA